MGVHTVTNFWHWRIPYSSAEDHQKKKRMKSSWERLPHLTRESGILGIKAIIAYGKRVR